MRTIIRLTNYRLIHNGTLHSNSQDLCIDTSTGLIINDPLSESNPTFNTSYDISTTIKPVNLHNNILAPAYLELQFNGALGVHFTHFWNEGVYAKNLESVSKWIVSKGVGSWWATLPTIASEQFEKVLPHLYPRSFSNGASLLGAHVEGPYLNPSKKGAHGIDSFPLSIPKKQDPRTRKLNLILLLDASLMLTPESSSLSSTYGAPSSTSNIKLLTLAPELPGSIPLITDLTSSTLIKVSLGHSAASHDTGIAAIKAGATCLTHVFNAMDPLHHREPGLAGLIALKEGHKEGEQNLPAPYFSLIADGIHLHPATVTLAFRANPSKCILITDAVEMAGLSDGSYAGHAQIPHRQWKYRNRVTIQGTETLIGGCSTIDECVKNLKRWSGCSLAEAVRCATENVAGMMGVETERGVIELGRRADFVVLNDGGEVLGTWVRAKEVFGDFDSK
ncbi:MAG: hypothetical protein Q9220_005066 [cf. Caloplaca sp. 1 TL-2023]